MSLNTGISKKVMIHLPLVNSSYCNELCHCSVDGCKFGGFTKWTGDDKRKIILQRMLKSCRKYKIDRSNNIQLNLGQHDFDMGMKDAIIQAKNQTKLS